MSKFKFYLPAEIIKAADPSSGEEEMRFKGLASTGNEDAQGEFLDPSGFDLTSFKWINWNHLGKNDPATIIGEPTAASITPKNEFLIEGLLYNDMPMAKSVFQLMKALSNSPSGNKLSLSVEGKVLERDPKNPKKITKSKITAVAICPVPVNSDTWVDLITKGFSDDNDIEKSGNEEYDEETKKVIESAGLTIVEESASNIKALRKSDIYEAIFNKYPQISEEQSKSVYNLIEKIATMTNEAKTVSEETIKKSFEILELASEEISKASTDEKVNGTTKVEAGEEEDEDEKEMTEKAYSKAKDMKKSGDAKEAMKEKLMKKGYGEKVANKAIEKAMNEKDEEKVEEKESDKEMKKSLSTLEDLIKSQVGTFNSKFEAIGNILKSQVEENTELKKSLDAVIEENATLKKDIEKALSQPVGRKSVTTKSFSERFEKSENGKSIYNLNSKTDRSALKIKLEELSGINKGDGNFNKDLMMIAQDIELTKSVTTSALAKLDAYDIQVVMQ